MKVEKSIEKPIFEQLSLREIERKFVPVFPERLEPFRAEGRPVEQLYLSHPHEPFSLRLRVTLASSGTLEYTATLKDRGHDGPDGIDRLEVEVPITEQDYRYYSGSEQLPVIRKLRSEPMPGVMIDFYDDGRVILESENPRGWNEFTAQHDNAFMEVTGDVSATNEWMAHLCLRRNNNGIDALAPMPDLNATDIVNDLLKAIEPGRCTTVHIGGRSGSGKSTLVREVEQQLAAHGVPCVILSTDDYHRGSSWLTRHNGGVAWTAWDDPIVYDTMALATDLAELRAGRPIWKRWIDFRDCEPQYGGTIQPAPVIIVEGIYAMSPDIYEPDAYRYEMTTPLATCIGRRLLRDMNERPEFADPKRSLSYMLREAEPAYRNQQGQPRCAA